MPRYTATAASAKKSSRLQWSTCLPTPGLCGPHQPGAEPGRLLRHHRRRPAGGDGAPHGRGVSVVPITADTTTALTYLPLPLRERAGVRVKSIRRRSFLPSRRHPFSSQSPPSPQPSPFLREGAVQEPTADAAHPQPQRLRRRGHVRAGHRALRALQHPWCAGFDRRCGAAPTRPGPRWTSTASVTCPWRRPSARR